jgi:hypothetical protein
MHATLLWINLPLPLRCGASSPDCRKNDMLRIAEPIELDYVPTALVLELEEHRQTPVVIIVTRRDLTT